MKSVEEQPGYKNLSDLYAERTSRILAWVGAGLSTSAGVPNWSELRKRLVDGGIGKANSLRPADMPRMRNALQMAA